jgi:hypothetical protein
MQNINCYNITYIAEYLQNHEQVCFKYINKAIYEIFKTLEFKIKDVSFRDDIPEKVAY